MSEKSKSKPSVLKKTVLITAGLVALYLFGTGPITRYLPGVAAVIYAPMTPVVQSGLLRPVFRQWYSVWGVNSDSATVAAKK